ncbi:MAG: hypothetical protein JNG85_03465, partial [Spirochaetaceae bacterium]|nr:hypothetical protein [Spirochaetaceae bacterium]
MVPANSCPCRNLACVSLALGERARGEVLPAAALRLLEPLPVAPERYPLALSRARVLARGGAGELVL